MKRERESNGRALPNLLGIVASVALGGGLMSCTSFYEVPIEVPISAKLDVAKYSRVLVAGFAVETTEDMDLDAETTRLLRNQLRMSSNLQVVEAEVEPLGDFSERTLKETGQLAEFERLEEQAKASGEEKISRQEWIDMEQDKLLNDEDYWRKMGEEFQEPLIVSGKLRFVSESRSGFVQADQYRRDSFGRPQLQRRNRFQERTGYVLAADLYFIDSSTGETIHRERFTEEVIYGRDEQVSGLSSYFELMDRMLPNFLSILSPQTFRGTRILLK